MAFDLNSSAADVTTISTKTVDTAAIKDYATQQIEAGRAADVVAQNAQTNQFNGPVENFTANPTPASPKGTFDSGFYAEQKYNELYHKFDLYLSNSGNFDKLNYYHINPAAVLGLAISDTVNDWVVDGSITFMYLPEGAPPLATTGNEKETNITGITEAAAENGRVLKSYEFRGDGFDLLRVMIAPKSSTGEDGSGIKIDENDPKWILSYLFSVYDVEDVNDVPGLEGNTATYMKCLRLKFHDVRYQMLQTTNLEYSTADPKDKLLIPDFQSGLANEGVLLTGEAIRDVLNEALSKPEKGGCLEFTTLKGPQWDDGASKLFYTSPAQYSALDDLNYLNSHHVSSGILKGSGDQKLNDLCLLHTERPSSFGLIEPLALTSLTSFFEKAGSKQETPGELQKEHFFITANTEEKPSATTGLRSPIGGNDTNIDVKTFKYGQIISYSFVDMSPSINSNMFRTTPVYSVDIGSRQFNIQFKGNDVLTARKTISESYINNNLYVKSSDSEKLFLPTIHKNKKNLNVFPTFSLNGDNEIVRQKNGLLNLIYTGLFQNACICFKTYGLTLRESGTFIAIDKTDGCANNDYNNKLYGQWFVVRVDHLFEAGAYVNIIYAVKLHRYDVRKAIFESTIDQKE